MASEILNFGSCVINGLPFSALYSAVCLSVRKCVIACVSVKENQRRIPTDVSKWYHDGFFLQMSLPHKRRREIKKEKLTDVSKHHIITVSPLKKCKNWRRGWGQITSTVKSFECSIARVLFFKFYFSINKVLEVGVWNIWIIFLFPIFMVRRLSVLIHAACQVSKKLWSKS